MAPQQVRPSTLHSYAKQCAYITEGLGDHQLGRLRPEHVSTWLADMREQGFAPDTIVNARARLRQVLGAAVAAEVIPTNVAALTKRPRRKPADGRALTSAEARSLLTEARSHPLGAVVALLFAHGWRVSEALGLAWEDIDLDAGTATVHRASTYAGGGIGQQLGPCKTEGTAGVHHLAPIVVELLRARHVAQAAEKLAAGPAWATHTYGGARLQPVFTSADGRLLLRQYVNTAVKECAVAAGLDPKGIATHTGRRSVVTALYAEEGLDLSDIARHVGHTSTTTTAGYVKDLGKRPKNTSDIAARLLDPTATEAR